MSTLYQRLKTRPDNRIDRIIRLAKKVFNTPIVLFNIVNESRLWPYSAETQFLLEEMPLAGSFCEETIKQGGTFVVSGTSQSPRFAEHPLVKEKPHIRFYAGHAIVSSERVPIGSLCLMDYQVRQISQADLVLLSDLAGMLEDGLRSIDPELSEQTVETQTALSGFETQVQRLWLLNEMATLLSQADSLDEVLDIASQKTYMLIEADRVSICLLNESGDRFTVFALSGLRGVLSLGNEFPLKGTNVSRIVKEQRPIIEPDIRNSDSPEIWPLAEYGLRSLINMPLIVRGAAIGSLNVASCQVNKYTGQDEVILRQVASLLATSIENRRLFERTQTALTETKVLYEAGQKVSRQFEMKPLLETVYQQIRRVVSVDAFFVGLYDQTTGLIHYPLVYDAEQIYQEQSTKIVSGSKIEQVLQTGETVLIHRTEAEIGSGGKRVSEANPTLTLSPDRAMGDENRISASLIFIPLKLAQRVTGVLSVQSYRLNAYRDQNLVLLQGIANQVAIAVENIRLYQQAQTRIRREERLRKMTIRVRNAVDVDSVMRLAAQEVGQGLGRSALISFGGDVGSRD